MSKIVLKTLVATSIESSQHTVFNPFTTTTPSKSKVTSNEMKGLVVTSDNNEQNIHKKS